MSTVHLPLDSPPVISAIAWGYHGNVRQRETFRLPDHWQFHLFPQARSVVHDGRPVAVPAGSCMLTPPGVITDYRFDGPMRHGYAHFRTSAADQGQILPMVIALGARFPVVMATFASAIAAHPRQPAHAQALLWGLLWDLVGTGSASHHHPALDRAVDLIDHRLASELRIRDLAAFCDLSHTHLLRLFREAYGVSINAYIRARRMELARRLLSHGDLPIAEVAARIGIRDLQHFNKLIRRAWGRSPRALRGTPAPR